MRLKIWSRVVLGDLPLLDSLEAIFDIALIPRPHDINELHPELSVMAPGFLEAQKD